MELRLLPRLLLLTLLPILLIGLVAGGLAFQLSQQRLAPAIEDSHRQQVALHSTSIESYLQQRAAELQSIADALYHLPSSQHPAYLLAQQRRLRSHYEALFIRDRDGVYTDLQGNPVSLQPPTRTLHVQGSTIRISDQQFSPLSGELTLVIEVQLTGQSHADDQSALVALLPVSRMVLEATRYTIGADAGVALVAEDGAVLMLHADGVAADITADLARLGTVRPGRYPLPGGSASPYAAVDIIYPLGWRLVHLHPNQPILTAEGALIPALAVALLLSLLLSAVILLLFNQQIRHPILRLTEALNRYRAGDSTARLATDRRDELGQLARAFNAMAEEHTISELRSSKAQLDLRTSEARYRALVETLPGAAFLVYDADLTFTFIAGVEITRRGMNPNDYVGLSLDEVFAQRIVNNLTVPMQAALDGETIHFEAIYGGDTYLTTIAPLSGGLGGVIMAQNVTALKQAEAEVEAQRAQLQAILTISPNIVFLYDVVNDRTLFSNRALSTQLGYSNDDFDRGGMTFLRSVVHPADYPNYEAHMHAVANAADGETHYLEFRLQNAAGQWVWLSRRTTVFERDADGRVSKYLGVAHDITERKQMEEALHRREQTATEFQQVLKALNEVVPLLGDAENEDAFCRRVVALGTARLGYDRLGVMLYDADSHMLRTTFGVDAQGEIADERGIVISADDDPHFAEVLAIGEGVFLKEDVALSNAWQVVGRGWNAMAALWDGTQVIGFLATDNLLTSAPPRPFERDLLRLFANAVALQLVQVRGQLALRRYAEQLEIQQRIEQNILRYQRIPEIARAVARPLAELVRVDYLSIVTVDPSTGDVLVLAHTGPPEIPDRLRPGGLNDDELGQLAAGQPIVVHDIETRRPFGPFEQVLYDIVGVRAYAVIPLAIDGQILGSINLGRFTPGPCNPQAIDITTQVGTQLAVAFRQNMLFDMVQQNAVTLARTVEQRTAQLQAKAAELESFSYSVSHDLRAPLRALDGFSRMLAEQFQADLPDRAQHYVGRIQTNAKRMGELIDDLLALSRVGRKALDFHEVDLTDLAREAYRELRQNTPPDDPAQPPPDFILDDLPPCWGDHSLLRQVYANLLSNALKYSSKTAQPQIHVGSQRQADGSVVYFVKDNGIGFDMTYADKLFGVFQRLHAESDFEGTGIGLAIVRRIVERHGGRVWATATPNQGATFYFTLPGDIGEE